MRIILLASIAAVAVTSAASAQTADGSAYIGVGYSKLDVDLLDFDGLNLIGGYTFNPYFAAEAEAYIGISEEEFDDGTISASVKTNYGLSAFLRAQYPLGEQVSVFGRVGYSTFELEAEANLPGLFSGGDSDTFDGLAYGIGGEVAFAGPNAVRIDYTRYEVEEIDDAGLDTPSMLSISYIRRF
ncbi:MAG: porin family protein [Oceanicaulis sp.]